ncbi:MAG: beta-ketoacyl-ACP synthase I [Hydrotalea sp.]|nr:beta-ketoacyl-ACP synthase I [Hydrotalea sp.]
MTSSPTLHRVAVTGIGIVSSIGNNVAEVLASLKTGKSGITFNPTFPELGMRSQVSGQPTLNPRDVIDKRDFRFMGDGAGWNYIAMQEAIKDAGLSEKEISNDRTGLVTASGGPSTSNMLEGWDTARSKGARRVSPFIVPRAMSSTNSATLATPFKIRGVNYSITSACSTSAHCVGHGAELIQWGKQDIVFAGGGEEMHWTMAVMFDAMAALSAGNNDNPAKASRAYDKNRDGFVIAAGGGMLVLENYERARARGAKIYAELTGYGANSDGYDMVQPSGEGAVRCMQMATSTVKGKIDYVNTHGTSTPVGDAKEGEALTKFFGGAAQVPAFSSTKSMTGHSLGATGVQEAIYSILMMEHNFIAPSINVDELDPVFAGLNIITKPAMNVNLKNVMSNSFGFGGTNACLVFSKPE